LVSTCKLIYAAMCCCGYRPSHAEGIFRFLIEIIVELSLLRLLQRQFSFPFSSFSCPWFFRDPNYGPLKICLVNKKCSYTCVTVSVQALLTLGYQRETTYGYPSETTFSLPQHIYVMWVYAYAKPMWAMQFHQCRNLMQRKSSLPLEFIVPQRKWCY